MEQSKTESSHETLSIHPSQINRSFVIPDKPDSSNETIGGKDHIVTDKVKGYIGNGGRVIHYSPQQSNYKFDQSYTNVLNNIYNEDKREGVKNTMEPNVKNYIDGRLDSIEKSMVAQEKLMTEKMEHLFTKMDSRLDNQLNQTKLLLGEFKEGLEKDKKESRKFLVTTFLSGLGVAVAIIIFALSN